MLLSDVIFAMYFAAYCLMYLSFVQSGSVKSGQFVLQIGMCTTTLSTFQTLKICNVTL